MKFSIIVPIYNVEKYLDTCLQSVLSQSYENFECILVDDGSSDSCPQICDEFAEMDTRIRVIHKKNGGLSSARNAGLLQARGDYIVFLDSDDQLCEGALQTIQENIGNEEVVIFNILHQYKDREIVVQDYTFVQNEKDILSISEKFASIFVQLPWRAYQSIYKREYLVIHQLFYDENIVGAEDLDFFLKLCELEPTVKIVNCCIIKYRAFREDSIIHTPSYKSIIGQLIVFAKGFHMAHIFYNSSLMKEYFANRFTNIIVLIHKMKDEEEKEECLRFVKENKNILSYTSNSAKYIVARIIWKIFGYKIGNSILAKIKGKE